VSADRAVRHNTQLYLVSNGSSEVGSSDSRACVGGADQTNIDYEQLAASMLKEVTRHLMKSTNPGSEKHLFTLSQDISALSARLESIEEMLREQITPT
jgi:hypothetical protein